MNIKTLHLCIAYQVIKKVGLYMSTFSKPVHMYTACLNQSAQISVVQINLGSRLDTRWILKILKKCIWISWKCWGTPHPKKYFNLCSKCNCSDRIWASDYECALQDMVGIKILHNQIPLLSHRDKKCFKRVGKPQCLQRHLPFGRFDKMWAALHS